MSVQKSLIYLTSLIVLLFSGCNTQTKFASSFGKRHYTKGFYWDIPANCKKTIALTESGKPSGRLESAIPAKQEASPVLIAKTEERPLGKQIRSAPVSTKSKAVHHSESKEIQVIAGNACVTNDVITSTESYDDDHVSETFWIVVFVVLSMAAIFFLVYEILKHASVLLIASVAAGALLLILFLCLLIYVQSIDWSFIGQAFSGPR